MSDELYQESLSKTDMYRYRDCEQDYSFGPQIDASLGIDMGIVHVAFYTN